MHLLLMPGIALGHQEELIQKAASQLGGGSLVIGFDFVAWSC